VAFIAVAGLAYLPFLESGVNPLGSLSTYAAKWRANDFLFGFLVRPGNLENQDLRLKEAKLWVAAIVVVVAAVTALLRTPRAAAIPTVLGTALIVSPTVHPWYLTWIIPFLAFRFSLPWLYLTLAVLSGYHPIPGHWAGRGWHESGEVKALAMVPFLALALYSAGGLLRNRRRHPVGSTSGPRQG
jgi:hypothetical protein